MKQFYLFLLVASLLGCSTIPELDGPRRDVPLFGVEGLFDGQLRTYQAGLNGFVMQPALERVGPVFELQGVLSKSATNEWLQLTFRDFRLSNPTDDLLIDSIVHPGSYGFQLGNGSIQRVRLLGLPATNPANPVVQYRWEVSGIPGQAPQVLFGQQVLIDVNPLQPLMVKLTTTHQDGCNSNLQREVDVQTGCIINFAQSIGSSSNLMQFDTTGMQLSAPPAFYWVIAGQTRTEVSPIVDLNQVPPVFPVSLVVSTSDSSCNQILSRNIQANVLAGCAANFNYFVTNDPTYELKKVRFNYRDTQGMTYSSAGGVQPAWAFFQVDSVSNYSGTDAASATLLVHGRMACRLYASDGNRIDMRPVAFSWAIPAKR